MAFPNTNILCLYVCIFIPYTMLGFYQYLNLSCDGFCHKIDSEMKNYQLKCAPAIVTGRSNHFVS
jgi:hypothetical protein